jgi:hypothetical protein
MAYARFLVITLADAAPHPPSPIALHILAHLLAPPHQPTPPNRPNGATSDPPPLPAPDPPIPTTIHDQMDCACYLRPHRRRRFLVRRRRYDHRLRLDRHLQLLCLLRLRLLHPTTPREAALEQDARRGDPHPSTAPSQAAAPADPPHRHPPRPRTARWATS